MGAVGEAPYIGTVVCAIIERGGGFLVARRPEKKCFGSCWEFPGGKVHEGESETEALHREIAEELGTAVRILERLTSRFHAYADFSLTLVPFRCVLSGPEPRPIEHRELRWITIGEAAEYDFPAADLPVLDEYRVKNVKK